MGLLGKLAGFAGGAMLGPAVSGGASALIGGFQAMRQRAWDKKMWDKTNKYNTPAAQMARYRGAGLNPNLVATQGDAGNAKQPTGGQKPNFQMPAGDVAGGKLKVKQGKLAEQQGDILSIQQDTEITKQVANLAAAAASMSGAGLKDAQTIEINTLLNGKTELLKGNIEKIYSDIGVNEANVAYTKARTILTGKEINAKELMVQIEQIKLDYMRQNPGQRLDDPAVVRNIIAEVKKTGKALGKLDQRYSKWLNDKYPGIYNLLTGNEPREKTIGRGGIIEYK